MQKLVKAPQSHVEVREGEPYSSSAQQMPRRGQAVLEVSWRACVRLHQWMPRWAPPKVYFLLSSLLVLLSGMALKYCGVLFGLLLAFLVLCA